MQVTKHKSGRMRRRHAGASRSLPARGHAHSLSSGL